MKQPLTGPFFIVCAALFWSFGGVLGKLIPWSGFSIAALRALFATLTLIAYRRSFAFKLNRSIVLAAISLGMTTLLFMVSNKLTTAANAIVLQYTAPIYIILLSWAFLKIKPQRRDGLALVGVGLGMVLFFVDQFQRGQWLGDGLALLSGLAFAGVFFANKLPGASPMEASYVGNLFSLVLLPMLLFDPDFTFNALQPWVLIALMGVVQLGLGYIFFSLGIQRTSATKAGIIATLEPILNPIWVFLIIGEQPSNLAMVGSALVLLTVMLYNFNQSKQNTL
jgi:drug/metabolite transporter (DMT)-like permease